MDSFFNRFSYAGKLKFLILVGVSIILIIVAVLINLQFYTIHLTENKMIGLDNFRTLETLLNKTMNLEHQNIFGGNEQETDAIINDLDKDMNDFAAQKNLNLDQQKDEYFNMLKNKLLYQWENLKTELNTPSQVSVSSYVQIVDTFIRLMDENVRYFQLMQDTELSTYLLFRMAALELSHIQKAIARTIALTKDPSSLQTKVELYGLSEDIRSFMETIHHFHLKSKPDFLALDAALATFLQSIDDPQKLPHSAKVAINQSYQTALKSSQSLSEEINYYLNQLLLYRNIVLILTAVCLSAIMLMYMTQVIRKPLENLKQAAFELGKGNMTIRVPITTQDEISVIGTEFNKMAEFFESILKNAKHITLQLVEGSSKIYDNAKQLESNLALQQKVIHHLSKETKAIASTSQNFSNSFKDIAKGAGFTSKLALSGSSSLIEMDNIMKLMVISSNEIVSTLSHLQGHVGKINGVISTIVKIADQSNLLSLNTAIKTRKSRLKGSGFAVVCDKIKELADQTAYGTLDIEQSVQQIVTVVNEAVEEVERFSSQIHSQVEEDRVFNESLKKIMDLTAEQISKFELINDWMEGQSEETKKIYYSILRLAEATQQSTQKVRSLFHEVELLYHGVQSLKKTTDQFHCSN